MISTTQNCLLKMKVLKIVLNNAYPIICQLQWTVNYVNLEKKVQCIERGHEMVNHTHIRVFISDFFKITYLFGLNRRMGLGPHGPVIHRGIIIIQCGICIIFS